MALIRTEYAGELAVLATWLSALLPWSVTVATQSGITAVHLRFLPLRFLYVFGVDLPGERPVLPVWEVPDFVGSSGVTTAAWVWVLGTVLFVVPFVVSVAYYVAEERVEAVLPTDPVRVLGGLLVLVGVVFAASTYLLVQHQFGTTIPIGTVFLLAFGVVLVGVERP